MQYYTVTDMDGSCVRTLLILLHPSCNTTLKMLNKCLVLNLVGRQFVLLRESTEMQKLKFAFIKCIIIIIIYLFIYWDPRVESTGVLMKDCNCVGIWKYVSDYSKSWSFQRWTYFLQEMVMVSSCESNCQFIEWYDGSYNRRWTVCVDYI